MPQYHVFSRKQGTDKGWRSEGVVTGKHGVRSAWAEYKRYLKGKKKKPDTDRQYFFFAINHARIWESDEKWQIKSYYGNHRKPTPEEEKARLKRFAKAHQKMIKARQNKRSGK
jgi:hypothetical protein